ncbi:unnamed protein product [Symbiodinium natans]|uniref:Apple domain-containing protein n=1 Tax=Symbiodinium natans TaxID=878477 RepID=A0A812I865_9DINO|nr:unnamed protein product [Symbiodinium natans]
MAACLSSGRLATHALAWALALAAHGESPASCLSTSAEYSCIANTSCGNEAMATHLGPMSLEACLAACQGFQDCQVIQYHCNTFCLLLRDCGTHADTACGGSLYLRNLDRAPGTALTTESVDLSKCYEGYAGDGQVLDDFTCTEASYCADKGWGVKDHHGMSLLRCSALCRATNCQAFQFGCSNSCTLFPTITDCTVKGPSTCSSIYWRLHNRSETEVSLALGRTAAYSPQACSFQGCWVSAQCPANSRPVACQTVPPNSGHGVYSTDQGCAAQGSGEAILAEAICMQGFSTSSVRSAWGIDNMTLSCPSGFLPVACNCLQNSWSVGEPCTGLNEFPPTFSADGHLVCTRDIDSGLGAFVRMSWNIGARISAICLPTTGTVLEYSLFNTRDSAGSAAESEARYCGWAKTHIRNDVDCSAWMRNPLPDGGCNMSECQGLADCAEVCTACSVCQGIYFYLGLGNVDDASYSQSPARCYFQGDTLNNINMAVEGYPSVATASSPWAVYVNSRDARCGPERFLRGVSFFQDSLCTELVVPSTLVASAYKDGTNYTLRAGWWKIPSRFAPRSCSSCPAKSLRVTAVFDPPVSVLCAIVDSSVDFAAGWTLSQGSSIDSAFAQSVSGSLVAFGSAHKSRSAPVMVRGATATLRGTMLLACALSVCPKDSIYLPQLLAGAMASVLGLRQHMIDFHGSPVRSEDERQVAQSYAFVMVVKIVVSTPADVGSYLNAAALLKHMRYHLAVLTEALQELHSLPFTVQQLSTFTEHVSVPQALHALPTLPTPRASTTTPITTRPLQELAGSLNDLGHSAYFIAFVGLIVPILGFI